MPLSKLAIGLLALSAGAAATKVALNAHGAAAPQTFAPASAKALPVPPTVVGMNLSPLAYWSGERPFADPIQSNGQFYIQLPGRAGEPLAHQVDVDANGFPSGVPKGTIVTVALQEFKPQQTGRYDCRISPGWSVTGFTDAAVNQSGMRFRLTISNGRWGVSKLVLKAEKDSASLSELACTPIDQSAANGVFTSALIDDLRPFRVIRFMNWMRANSEPPSRWADRATPKTRSQAERGGVALEHMVDLAARLDADPWFTVPLNAGDDDYRNFAIYVRDHLSPGRRAYVEVSNEVWNTGFSQSKEASRLGQVRYPSSSAIEANDYFYADRVRAVMSIWGEVFGADLKRRVVRVLSSQAVYAQRADNSLRHDGTAQFVDAVAIAPYFGQGIQSVSSTGDARLRQLATLGPGYIEQAINAARASKAVAAKYGLPLIAYEAGPDFIGYNPEAKADGEAWRKSPELSRLYRAYLDRWRAEIGGLIVLFDSAGKDGYGHKLYTGQPLADAPLMKTVVEFARWTDNDGRKPKK